MAKKQPKDYNKPKYDRQKEKARFERIVEMDTQARRHMQEIGNPVKGLRLKVRPIYG